MKPKQLFWGICFVTLGILFLSNSVFHANISFGSLVKFWPVIPILLGANLLFEQPYIKASTSGIAGLFLGLVIFSLISHPFSCTNIQFSDTEMKNVNFTLPDNPQIKRVEFTLNAGAGAFSIGDDDTNLVKIISTDKLSRFAVDTTITDSVAEISLKMKEIKATFGNDSTKNNGVGIKLSTRPVYSTTIEIGAATANLDFSKLKVDDLTLKMGAAALHLSLGKPLKESNVTIEAGASSINITIPKDAAVSIETDMALSSKNMGGLVETSHNNYESEGFDSAKNKFIIKIDGGLSSLNIQRF
jgi:hypothetical protein